MDADGEDDDVELRLIASYGYKQRKNGREPVQDRRGARRPGGAREEVDPDHRGAGRLHPDRVGRSARRAPLNIIVLPVLFEDQVMAVIELASFQRVHAGRSRRSSSSSPRSIGVVLNTIQANMRTEELLEQSQSLDAGAAEPVRGAADAAGGAPAVERGARGAGGVAQGVGGAAPAAAGGAAADERGARGEGAPARGAERAHRDQEPARSSSRGRRSRRRPSSSRSRRSTRASSSRTCRTSCARRSTRC